MTAGDRSYFIQRAETELQLAKSAAHPAAVRAHYHLAGYYLDKAYSLAEATAAFAGAASASGDETRAAFT